MVRLDGYMSSKSVLVVARGVYSGISESTQEPHADVIYRSLKRWHAVSSRLKDVGRSCAERDVFVPASYITAEMCQLNGTDESRAEVGEGVTYAFAIENTGSTTLTNVQLSSETFDLGQVRSNHTKVDVPRSPSRLDQQRYFTAKYIVLQTLWFRWAQKQMLSDFPRRLVFGTPAS